MFHCPTHGIQDLRPKPGTHEDSYSVVSLCKVPVFLAHVHEPIGQGRCCQRRLNRRLVLQALRTFFASVLLCSSFCFLLSRLWSLFAFYQFSTTADSAHITKMKKLKNARTSLRAPCHVATGRSRKARKSESAEKMVSQQRSKRQPAHTWRTFHCAPATPKNTSTCMRQTENTGKTLQ